MEKQILAGCIIFNNEGSILLLHRNTYRRQQWEIPGGRIETGEVTSSAAIREAKEEIGVEIEVIKKLGSKEFEEDGVIIEYTWFLSNISNEEPKITEPEKFDDIGYFSWDDLRNNISEISPNVVNLLNEYTAGRIDLL